ncbi:MAG: DUF2254 family protein [Halobacteriota archaeon]|nr:DUF2254 family protein [Halobacteriota archaeon]
MNLKLEKVEVPLIAIILGIFSILLLISITDIIPFSIANDNIDNAREIFEGVGVEGLSGIFAIVMSLSLMAVEFASQQYTHRIADAYIKSAAFWAIVTIYLGSIVYNVFMLSVLSEPVSGVYVDVSILLSTFCIVMLVPHFFITVTHLNPDFIIGRILKGVDEDYIGSIEVYFDTGKLRIPTDQDRMLPVAEIIERSIGNGDRSTARFGLDEIQSYYLKYLNKENEEYVSPYFLDYILGIGREAIIESDDDSMIQVLKIFGDMGKKGLEEDMFGTSKMTIEDIGVMAHKVVKRDHDAAIKQIFDSLHLILDLVRQDHDEIVEQIFFLYDELSTQLFVLKSNRMVKYMTKSVSDLLGFENSSSFFLEKTAAFFGDVGRYAVNFDVRDVIHESVSSLHQIGILSAKNEMVDLVDHTLEYMLKIENECVRYESKSKEFTSIINEVEYAKKDIEGHLETTDFSDIW